MKWSKILIVCSFVIATICNINTSSAQEVLSTSQFKKMSAQVFGGCRKDIVKFCSTITVSPKRVLLCLQAHDDQVRPDCRGAVFGSTNSVLADVQMYTDVAEICWNDIEKLCANIELGKGRIVQCLIDKRSQLSSNCKTKLSFE